MIDGLSYLITQVAFLLVVTLILGIGLGWLLKPRPAVDRTPTPEPQSTDEPDDAAQAAELQPLLDQAQRQIIQLRDQLTASDTETARLRDQVRSLADEKETEMGRLESGAIAALESTISKNEERVAELHEQLRTAGQTVQEAEARLESERKLSVQLQDALAECNQRLAERSS